MEMFGFELRNTMAVAITTFALMGSALTGCALDTECTDPDAGTTPPDAGTTPPDVGTTPPPLVRHHRRGHRGRYNPHRG